MRKTTSPSIKCSVNAWWVAMLYLDNRPLKQKIKQAHFTFTRGLHTINGVYNINSTSILSTIPPNTSFSQSSLISDNLLIYSSMQSLLFISPRLCHASLNNNTWLTLGSFLEYRRHIQCYVKTIGHVLPVYCFYKKQQELFSCLMLQSGSFFNIMY